MKRLLYVTLVLLWGLGLSLTGCTKEQSGGLCEDYLQGCDSVEKRISYYGDLSITTVMQDSGTSVLCIMSLSDVQIGFQILSASQNRYNFDLKMADYFACGTLSFTHEKDRKFSKVSGEFEYSAIANNQIFRFKGDITYWRSKETVQTVIPENVNLILESYGRIDLF